MELLKEQKHFRAHHTAHFVAALELNKEVIPVGTYFLVGQDMALQFMDEQEFRLKGLWSVRINKPFMLTAGRLHYGIDALGYSLSPMLNEIIPGPGVLSYISGCSNSEILPPARNGDPCINMMYMPTDVNQTWHVHPSMRIGAVVDGFGISEWKEGVKTHSHPLKPGDVFLIKPMELHRFKTENNGLCVVIYHPDSEGGPKDALNPMYSRTYITKEDHA